MALALGHAIGADSDHGNALDVNQILYILATSGNHGSLVQICHSYIS